MAQVLRSIEQDTLIIWGEDDRLFSVVYGEAAAKIMPNARFYSLPKAGHLVHIDQPKRFNEAVMKFLLND